MILTAALVVAGWLVIVLFLQRPMLFPAHLTSRPDDRVAAEPVSLPGDGGPFQAWYLPPLPAGPDPAPLLIFTHGNGETAHDWVDHFATPRSWGWAVLLPEYPGYSGTPGRPSEASILAMAAAAHDWARQDPRVDPGRIVPYGRSLGGGPAVWLAAHRSVAGLILESAFTSTRPLAARFGVPGFLVRDPFDNLTALKHYRGPLLVLHGETDRIVPPSHGRALAGAVGGAVLELLPCGHNDCDRPWNTITRFLAALGLPAGERPRDPDPDHPPTGPVRP